MNIRKIHQSIGFWAVMLLLLALALQYAGGWYVVELTGLSKENELEDHMADLGRVATLVLAETVEELNSLAYEATWMKPPDSSLTDLKLDPDPQTYLDSLDSKIQSTLVDFADQARLSSIVVLDRSGLILFHTQDPDQVLEPWLYDQPWIRIALDGRTASPPAYQIDKLMFKRFYIPVVSTFGSSGEDISLPSESFTSTGETGNDLSGRDRVDTLICLVAGRDYLGEIGHLTRSVRRTAFILTLLLSLIGYLIFRLMQKQRKVERQAAEADRLASLGTLSAGFAHELRNPLGIIRAFIEDLEHSLRNHQKHGDSADLCRDIIEETDRMNQLVSQFLDYSHGKRQDTPIGNAHVLESIRSVQAILSPVAEKKGIRLEIPHDLSDSTSENCTASIEPDALKQVIMNLMMNSIEMSGRGTRIQCSVSPALREVTLEISDEGPGIPRSDVVRIFEPFYSTRPGGSGLGLAVCRQIIQNAGGTLDLDTSCKTGARFIIRLSTGKENCTPTGKPRTRTQKPDQSLRDHETLSVADPQPGTVNYTNADCIEEQIK
jgi:signal transduction histidine kinase